MFSTGSPIAVLSHGLLPTADQIAAVGHGLLTDEIPPPALPARVFGVSGRTSSKFQVRGDNGDET